MPLPATATPHATLDHAWEVPNATFEQVVAWYDHQFPEGQPWRDWEWCERKEIGEKERTVQWLWHQEGTSRILGVFVVDDETPAVLIGPPDESGPC